MRNVLKKVTAAVLALAMCLSFAGCYDENKTWAAKKGDDTLPIGSYIYYLNSAYSEAAAKVGTEDEVLKATIEDKDASAWIKDRAMQYLGAYYYINSKFSELGLELTEEELSNAQTATTSTWSYYKDTFEAMGIAQESFHQAYSLYNAKFQKAMQAMYGEGGEKALPEEELKTYFTDNYYSYEYFYVSLSKTAEDGSSVDLTDDEKSELKTKLEGYVEEINSGDSTVTEAADDYAYETQTESTYNAPTPTKKDSLNTTILNAISPLEDNKTTFAETTSGYYVIKKLPIADKFAETTADETQMRSLLSDMKGEEFNDFVLEQGKALTDVEVNQKAIDSVKVSSLVTDSNKKGTSSAASETESSTASSAASSEVSSAAESSQTESSTAE